MPPLSDDKSSLLDKLEGTSSDNLPKGVESVDKLGEKDFEDAVRAHNHGLNKNKALIKKCIHWALFFAGLILLNVAVIALIKLLYIYITDVSANVNSVKELLFNVWNTVLIALATLFVDRSTGKK